MNTTVPSVLVNYAANVNSTRSNELGMRAKPTIRPKVRA